VAAYEYDIFTIAWGHGGTKAETKIREELNARGADGWELVGMTRDESPQDEHEDEVVLFVFKRQAKKAKKAKADKAEKKKKKKQK
jgi:hypothetical protein